MTERETPHAVYDAYLRWLKAGAELDSGIEPGGEADATFCITLAGERGSDARELGHEIAAYLNAVDPVASGCWASFDETSLDEITSRRPAREDARPSSTSRVLAFPGGDAPEPVAPRRRTLRTIAEAGAAVIIGDDAHDLTRDLGRAFHVRLASSDAPESAAASSSFHLTVNTGRMQPETTVRVIADSALEWALHLPTNIQ